jgi:hypothetical protein
MVDCSVSSSTPSWPASTASFVLISASVVVP